MSPGETQNKGRMTIILHSGAYDRVSYALSLAMAALASEMEVYILLTYEGLRRFTQENISTLGEETPASLRSDLNWGIEAGAILPLKQQVNEAKQMGLKIFACPTLMACLKIPKDQLFAVDDVMGLFSFLEISRTADIHWYI